MSLLHTELRMVLLARDVLQEHAWKRLADNDPKLHRALQDAADSITDALQVIGEELE